jgi:hypothetical protein
MARQLARVRNVGGVESLRATLSAALALMMVAGTAASTNAQTRPASDRSAPPTGAVVPKPDVVAPKEPDAAVEDKAGPEDASAKDESPTPEKPRPVAGTDSQFAGRLGALPAQSVEPSAARQATLRARNVPPLKITNLKVVYGTPTAKLPAESELMQIRVVLSKRDGVLYDPWLPGERVEARIEELSTGTERSWDVSALEALNTQIFSAFSRIGIGAVQAVFAPGQINRADAKDLRKNPEFTIGVFVGEVAQIRSIAMSDDLARRENLDQHEKLRDRSPIKPGDPVKINELDDYVLRLNRHPGRRVDVSLAPYSDFREGEAKLTLDYLVSQAKPWTIYGQVSNTGTDQTEKWRERIGFTHTNLTGNDDIFRLDYLTAGFAATHAVTGSYEFPIADRLTLRAFASYSKYKASDVGFSGRTFSGETWDAGGELVYNILQYKDWFFDVLGGARYQEVMTTDSAGSGSGDTNFFYPYIGTQLERNSDAANTSLALILEFQSPLVGTDEDEANRLGRSPVDTDWTVLKIDAAQSFYLEPLFAPETFAGRNLAEGRDWQPGMSLAHEIQLGVRSQVAFDDRRLIPNAQTVAGGMFTVRGYPESVAVGDSSVVGSAEYRFHVPRWLEPKTATADSFKWVPDQVYGKADWDLILKGFVDAGATFNNEINRSFEKNQTLIGAGVGMELQLNTKVRGSIRLDWGFALKGITEADGNQRVDSGDNRLHVSFLLLF